MNVGANDRKKVFMLGGLVLVAGYLFYSNVLAGPSVSSSASVTPRPAATPDPVLSPATAAPANATTAPRIPQARGRGDEFRPVLPGHSKRPEDKFEPEKVDPTLRLDLLAKIQEENSTAGRNLFQFGMAPPPKPVEGLKGPEPKVLPKPAAPVTPVKVETPPAGPPPPPPINLKYYGYSSVQGSTTKTAFFLDGEDILTAREGDVLKRRYKLVRIGNNSAVMEDTESKRQQTIPLAEEAG